MRIWTLFPVALAMLAVPALAADPPALTATVPHKITFTPLAPPACNPNVSVFFEVRILKAPAGFCERTGLKLTGNITLTDTALQQLMTAAQAQRDVNVMQLPKITAFDGQECSVRNCEERSFTTGGEIVRAQGQSVFVPKNKSIELGDVLTVCGHVSADDQAVAVSAKLTRTALAGDVELFPVVTQITPIFEGGSQGKPVPFTQFLQSPDVKTEQIEKTVVVQAGKTIVLGGWKETGERPGRKGLLKKDKTVAEYEVVAFATVRVARNEESAVSVAPMPRTVPGLVTKVFPVSDIPLFLALYSERRSCAFGRGMLAAGLRDIITCRVRPDSWQHNGGKGALEFSNVERAIVVTNTPDAVKEVGELLAIIRQSPVTETAVAPMPHASTRSAYYTLRNVAVEDAAHALREFLRGKKLAATLTTDLASNTLLVSAEADVQKQIHNILVGLDKTPTQIVVQAMVLEAPRGFVAQSGLNAGGASGARSWVLSQREAALFAEVVRGAQGRGECDILSRPQLQVCDNQTGFVQVGQNYPISLPPRVVKNGKANAVADPQPDVQYSPIGLTLRVTPRVAPNGKSVLLRTEGEWVTVGPPVVQAITTQVPGAQFPVTEYVRLPEFRKRVVNVTQDVGTGGVLVVALADDPECSTFLGRLRAAVDNTPEALVVLTPHVIVPEPSAVRPASCPPPQKPVPLPSLIAPAADVRPAVGGLPK